MRNSMRSVLRHVGVALGHPVLHLDRAATALTGLANSASTPSPVRLDDAPLVLGDLAVDQLAPMRLEARERALLVGADQPRVAHDIRGKNGGKPTLHDSSVVEQSGPRGRGRGDRPDIIWGLRRGSVCAPSGILGFHRHGHDLAPSGFAADGSLPSPGNPDAVSQHSVPCSNRPGPGPVSRALHARRVSRAPALVSPAMGCCGGRRVAMKGCRRFDP